MSRQDRREDERDVAEINGIDYLHVAQVSFNEYRVVSRRNGDVTSHLVNLKDGSCTCMDMAYQQKDQETCDHVFKATLVAETTADTSEHIMRFLSDEVRRLEEAAATIEGGHTADDGGSTPDGSAGDSAAESGDSAGFDGDPVEAFKSLLRDAGLDPDAFHVYVHDQFGSLQIDQDGYLESEDFQRWVDLSDDLGLGYDGDDDVNILPEEDWDEVLG